MNKILTVRFLRVLNAVVKPSFNTSMRIDKRVSSKDFLWLESPCTPLDASPLQCRTSCRGLGFWAWLQSP